MSSLAKLRYELAALQFEWSLIKLMRKYRQDQPRAPAGTSEGGRWIYAGGRRIAQISEDENAKRGLIEDNVGEMRRLAFDNAVQALRRIDPAKLAYVVSGPDFIPSQDHLDAIKDELENARETISRKIAAGHGFKHAVEFGLNSRDAFGSLVRDTIGNPSNQVRDLLDGRTLFYNARNNVLVFVNPRDPDGGTMFRPKDRQAYVDGQR